MQDTNERHGSGVAVWFFRTLLLLAAAVVMTVALVPGAQAAESQNSAPRSVIPLGRAVGIKLFAQGVLVVGLSDITTDQGLASPARACGLQEGDVITHINDAQVSSIEEVQTILQDLEGQEMELTVLRDEESQEVTTRAAQCSTDGAYKLGAWIRDSMAGIGTLTFVDPETGLFGTLGHGINDVDTAQLMPLQSGSIMYSEVTDVKKGEKGAPGELHGAFQVNRDLGELYANTASGVFGRLEDGTLTDGLEPVPVAERKEVKTGAATILSNIAGDQVEEYQVEIIRVYPANGADTRNLMLKVTDPRLLETTGGIVQGMSGSPILQNGKLVGAVTHVLVNDPTQGYGILAENMLLEAKNGENQS